MIRKSVHDKFECVCTNIKLRESLFWGVCVLDLNNFMEYFGNTSMHKVSDFHGKVRWVNNIEFANINA